MLKTVVFVECRGEYILQRLSASLIPGDSNEAGA